ncbi:MAG: two-component system response regulator [Deltaproteobacteria bacterium]|nr:MAG: two-component system response regulator [Deltaproteobacteria bacterium]
MEKETGCTILAVDDAKLNIDILVGLLGDKYELAVALGGEGALKYLEENTPDLVLLDLMMPDIDGLAVLRHIKKDERIKDIPVLVLTALSDSDKKELCFRLGAVDYVQKPFDANELLARVKTHLSLSSARRQLEEYSHNLEELVEKRTRELLNTQQATIESMAAMVEYRDPETGSHINRTKGYVNILASRLSKLDKYREMLTPGMIELMTRSAPLHDIGKVGIPDHILLKPGKLTRDEFEIMKRHSEIGARVILSVQKKVGMMPFLDIAREIAYSHHEKWNGKGYPLGLTGADIPLSGRIMALGDVYDALISRRVYKPPFAHTKAVQIILEEKGESFDPDIVDAFSAACDEIRNLALDHCESEEQYEALHQ